MAQACGENAGKILFRNQISHHHSFSNKLYMCVHLRNRWSWQELDKVSAKSFKKNLPQITNNITEILNNQVKTTKNSNMEMKNCPIDAFNGTWVPNPVGEEVAYVNLMNNNRWLYLVQNNGNPEWWIGTTPNKNAKRPWGWLRQAQATTQYLEPWDVQTWKWYNDQTKKWIPNSTIEFQVETKEMTIDKTVIKRVSILEKAFEAKMDEYREKVKIATDHAHHHEAVSRLLFNNLTTEERRTLIDKSEFRALFREEDLCSVCFSKDKTTKCVHADCTGACAKCRGGDQDAACCACGKEQILECPVCMESHPPSFMNRFPCLHAVCWRCHCKSYEAKKPILKCPMCRKNLS